MYYLNEISVNTHLIIQMIKKVNILFFFIKRPIFLTHLFQRVIHIKLNS